MSGFHLYPSTFVLGEFGLRIHFLAVLYICFQCRQYPLNHILELCLLLVFECEVVKVCEFRYPIAFLLVCKVGKQDVVHAVDALNAELIIKLVAII